MESNYSFTHGSGEIPEATLERFAARKQQIGQVEQMGALTPYLSVPELAGRLVLHWIDNTAAVTGLIKGYSRALDSARIVHAFHAFNVGFGARVWFEYIRTDANVADAPSREHLGEIEYEFAMPAAPGMGSLPVPLKLPQDCEWAQGAEAWARAARRG